MVGKEGVNACPQIQNGLALAHTKTERGLAGAQVEVGLVDLHTTDTFEKLMGRKPRSVTEFVQDHIGVFKG